MKPPQPARPFGPERRIRCLRTGEDYDAAVHASCPYCHGSQADLSTGDRTRFCGYDPAKDPLNFGFPPGSSRNQRS